MRDQIILNYSNIVTRDREDPLRYFEIPYTSEIQTPKLDEFSSERQIKREKFQSREMDSLDNKYLGRQALRVSSQDRCDDQRWGKCDCNERSKNSEFTGYFHRKGNLNTGKVAGYYYNTHAEVAFEKHPSNRASDDRRVC